jgi:hypothetical protein
MVRVDQESDQGGKFFSYYLIVLAIGCNNAPSVPLPNQPVSIRFFVGVDPSGAPTNSASAPTKSAGAYTETLEFSGCQLLVPRFVLDRSNEGLPFPITITGSKTASC